MKTPLLVLLPFLLGACAGGPLTTDRESAFDLAENSATDQEFSMLGDARVMSLLTMIGAALQAVGEAQATYQGEPIPVAVAAALEAIGADVPSGAAKPPDPATRPSDGFDWSAVLEALGFGAGGGLIASLLRRMLKNDPIPKLAALLRPSLRAGDSATPNS